MNEQWMPCTTCKAIVQLNATGICLGCQGGFNPQNKEDRYLPKEGEDAIQKQETKSMDVQPEARDGEGMGKGNAEGQEAPSESKKEKKWWKKQKEEMKNE